MLPPDAAKKMQEEIGAALEAASKDPELRRQADEAAVAAKEASDRMIAARVAGSGYIGALYGELVKRGLIKQ